MSILRKLFILTWASPYEYQWGYISDEKNVNILSLHFLFCFPFHRSCEREKCSPCFALFFCCLNYDKLGTRLQICRRLMPRLARIFARAIGKISLLWGWFVFKSLKPMLAGYEANFSRTLQWLFRFITIISFFLFAQESNLDRQSSRWAECCSFKICINPLRE